MKKYGICVLGMSCILSLTGCSGDRQEQDNDVQISDTVQADVEPEEADSGNENVENNDSENSTSGVQEESEIPEVSVPDVTPVTYSYEDLYMAVDIPEGWDYKIKSKEDMDKEDGLLMCAIEFWPEGDPETVFELGYAEQFGICGTGVTIEEFTLENSLSGHRYTEKIEDTLWLTITFYDPDRDVDKISGTYLIDASPELSVWEDIEPEFEKILESVWVGSLPDGGVE